MMVVRLDGPDGGACALGPGEHMVGSSPRSAVLVDDESVDECHATLLVRPFSVLVADRRTDTGTWLNGTRIEIPTVIADGDVLRVGPAEWRVRVDPAAAPAEPVDLPARIEVVEGDRIVTARPIADGEVIWIGRAADADWSLPDRFCSRRHAVLRREGERLLIQDAGSVNGVTIGAERVREARLSDGDVVVVGQTSLRFRVQKPPPPVTPGRPSLGRFGPYRLYRELGRGGMGRVFEADRDGEPPIALKIMRTDRIHEDAAHVRRRRFEREAQVLRRIRHENVVGYLGAGEHDARPYLALELLEGQALIDLLRAGERLATAEIERIVFQLCAAVQAVHESGVVHRDIKPANVILHGPKRTVKLMDFGIARFHDAVDLTGDIEELASRAVEQGVTAEGKNPGTPLFMSPEQVRGRGVDMRSDIWSLGVVLYLLVSGRPPFETGAPEALKQAVLTACPEPLPESTPAYLRSAIYRCLLKQPSHRFRTATALMEALHERRLEQPVPVGTEGPTVAPPTFCPSCGSYVSAKQNECPVCRLDLRPFRTRQLVAVEIDGQFVCACGGCGLRADLGNETCPRCGRLFAVPRSAAELLDAESLSAEDAAALTNGLKNLTQCPVCAAPADPAQPQCPACGVHLPAVLLGRVVVVCDETGVQRPCCGNCGTRMRSARPACAKCGLNFITGRLRDGTIYQRADGRRRK